MGNFCYKETPARPSVDVYLDKLIKYLVLPTVFILGLVSLIVLYLVDKVNCYNSKKARDYLADEFCWNSFQSAYLVPGTSKWISSTELPHKIFPIMLMCEPVAIALPLIIWYWCFGKDFSNEIHSVIGHANSLTEYYRKYDKGMRKTVTEATLHREIDNFFEYLAFLLMSKSRKFFILYVLKWCSLLIVIAVCFAGCFGILYPDLTIFADKFNCLVFDSNNLITTVPQRVSVCSIPTFMFLRAVWYFNIVVLGLLILGSLILLIELFLPRHYTDTFFYKSIPGIMDSRLADCIHNYYNARHIHLISKFCDHNSHLCSDIGLSKSLSRKYGIFDGKTPGRETIMDKHFPVIQPEQIDRFRLSSQLFFQKKRKTKTKLNQVIKRRKVYPKSDRHVGTSESENHSSGYDSLRISLEAENDSLNYMTPNLMARKLEKDEKDILNMSYITESQNRTSRPTPRSIASDVTFEDLEFQTSTPRTVNREIHPERLYGGRYGVKFEPFDPKTIDHYPKFASRTRELNPFAYRLRNVMRQNKADNLNKWRP